MLPVSYCCCVFFSLYISPTFAHNAHILYVKINIYPQQFNSQIIALPIHLRYRKRKKKEIGIDGIFSELFILFRLISEEIWLVATQKPKATFQCNEGDIKCKRYFHVVYGVQHKCLFDFEGDFNFSCYECWFCDENDRAYHNTTDFFS